MTPNPSTYDAARLRRRRLARSPAWPQRVALAACLAAGIATSAQAHPYFIYKAIALVAGNAKVIGLQAGHAYRKAQRVGTCDERRARLQKILPETLRLSRYARDIFNHGDELKGSDLKSMDLGDGVTANYEPAGQRYAEVTVDAEAHEVIVVFQGTRLSVGSDLSTDVLGFVGIEPAYYQWASNLVGDVVRKHPGWPVVVTGHSLGGGLVLYSVLHNPGVRGVAFNPAGVSWRTWLATSRPERARAGAALTIISTHNGSHIEPLTALSFAHRTVLPGQRYFVETDAGNPLSLHAANTVVASLEHLAATGADGAACDGVLGEPPAASPAP